MHVAGRQQAHASNAGRRVQLPATADMPSISVPPSGVPDYTLTETIRNEPSTRLVPRDGDLSD
jgi:hypothetical protein